MSRVNHNANVTVRMKGLALAHYNDNEDNNVKNDKWEFIFLRGIPNHKLKIIVREYRNNLPAPIERIYPIPEDYKKISITTTNPVPPKSSQYLTKNFGHRVAVDDSRDARWMIDLETLHNEPIALKKADERTDKPINLTYLSISDSMLYADTIFDQPYQITKNGEEQFSRVMGAWLGLDIQWADDESKTDINFESQDGILDNISLVYNPNVSIYEIEINNDCCGGGEPDVSDFHYYYDYLIKTEEKFDEVIPPNRVNLLSNLLGINAVINSNNFGSDSCKGSDCCAKLVGGLQGISSLEEIL